VADVGPEVEVKTFGDDFATAKPNHLWLRCLLAAAFEHGQNLAAPGADGVGSTVASWHNRSDLSQIFAGQNPRD
jgi:hypothetical protein